MLSWFRGDWIGKLSGPAVASSLLFPLPALCAEAKKDVERSSLSEPAVAVSALADAQIEPGFRLELVAGPSLVTAPIAMAFDENGRLFVVEAPGPANAPSGRIRLLQDTNSDGVFDTSKVFAEKLPWPSAVACYAGGVFVGATPSIFFLKDSKGSGFADVRKVSFGDSPAANAPRPATRATSFNWGLDNRIHGVTGPIEGTPPSSNAPGQAPTEVVGSEFSFDPRGLTLSSVTDTGRLGLSYDNRGRAYMSDQTRRLLLEMYDRRYMARNPFFEVPLQAAPILRGIERGKAFAIYRGNAFRANYLGNAFIADDEGQAIQRVVFRDNGLELVPSQPPTEFVVSKDPSFHPAQVINGPDGALYVASAGGIYRILPAGFSPSKAPLPGKAGISELVEMLAYPNGWQRDAAARLLYERQDPAAPPMIARMASGSKNPLGRLHALHVLEGFGLLNEEALRHALRDGDERVREHAVLLAERAAVNGVSDGIWRQLRSMAGDPSIRVRYQLAFAVGAIQRPDKAPVLAAILAKNPDDLWVQAAVLSSVADCSGDLFLALVRDARFGGTAVGQEFLRQLVIMIGVQGRTAALGRVLDFIDGMPSDATRSYALLYELGEGLRRQNSTLALADPQGRMRRFYAQALKIGLSSQGAEPRRVAAMRMLGVSPNTYATIGDLLLIMLGLTQPLSVQDATVEALGRFSDQRIAPALFRRWRVLEPQVRTAAVTALLSRSERVPDVVAALEQGQIQAEDFTLLEMDYLRTYPDAAIARRATQIFGPLTSKRPDALKRYAAALQLPGSAEHGREIFVARCALCHPPYNGGPGAGPALDGVRSWKKEKILSAILEPNAEIRPEYAAVVAETMVGDTYIGVLVNNRETTVTLRLANGAPVVIPRSNLRSLEVQPWSIMPEGLEAGFTSQDMADLLRYLVNP
jgi:putative heme-binding domain-containing protein